MCKKEEEFRARRAEALNCPVEADFLKTRWPLDLAIRIIHVYKIWEEFETEILDNSPIKTPSPFDEVFDEVLAMKSYLRRVRELVLDNIDSGILSTLSDDKNGKKRIIIFEPRTFLLWAKNQGFPTEQAMELLDELQPSDGSNKVQESKFLTPQGTLWDDITVKLRDEESVMISIKNNTPKLISRYEIGFKRKNSTKPPESWTYLKLLARLDSEMPIPPNTKHADKMGKQVDIIRKILQGFFNIEDNPIPCDKTNRIYRAKFHIKPENELEDIIRDTKPNTDF